MRVVYSSRNCRIALSSVKFHRQIILFCGRRFVWKFCRIVSRLVPSDVAMQDAELSNVHAGIELSCWWALPSFTSTSLRARMRTRTKHLISCQRLKLIWKKFKFRSDIQLRIHSNVVSGFHILPINRLSCISDRCKGGSRYVEGCWGTPCLFFGDLDNYPDSAIVKFRFVGKNLGEADCFWPTRNSKIFKTIPKLFETCLIW